MAYIFDPLRNTFIDDEDTSLGNKLAFLDEDLEKAIREIGEKYGPDAIKTLDQLPENKPAEVEDTERFNRFNRMYEDGGMVRQNFFAGAAAIPFASTLSYPVSYGMAAVLGLSTAGGAKVLGDRVTNYLKENPEIFNDPRFKAAALTFGLNIPGVIAPDADEMEKVRQDIEKNLKPGETKKIDIPLTTTGDSEPPKIDTTETFPAPEEKLPITTGGSEIPEQLPIIFEAKIPEKLSEKALEDLKPETVTDINKIVEDYKALKTRPAGTFTVGTGKNARVKTLPASTRPTLREEDKIELINLVVNKFKEKEGKNPSATELNTFLPLSGNKSASVIAKANNINLSKKISKGFKDDLSYIANMREKQQLKANENNTITEFKGENFFPDTITLENGDVVNGKKFFIDNLVKRTESGPSRTETLATTLTNKQLAKLFNTNVRTVDKIVTNIRKSPDFTADYPKIRPKTYYDRIVRDRINRARKYLKPNELENVKLQEKHITYVNDLFKDGTLVVTDFPNIVERINTTMDKKTGIIDRSIKKTDEEMIERSKDNSGLFDVSHTIAKTEVEKGAQNIEYLRNRNFADYKTNQGFYKSAEAYVRNEMDDPEYDLRLEELDNYLKEIGQRVKIGNRFFGVDEAMIDSETGEFLGFNRQLEYYGLPKMENGVPLKKVKKVKKAKGGPIELSPMPRANFGNGGAAGADDDFAAQLEYFFLNPEAELPAAQTFRETKNPISIVNDMIDPRNIPYYADRLVESGIRIGEFGARVLPAVGKLAADLIQKPAFKIKPASGQGYVQDYTDILPSNITGTGIFSEFLNNLVGDEGTKVITEKTGLAKLIKDEEQKMKDERKTAGAKILADQFTLGMELTAPIFPGLKLLKAFAKNRNLPEDKTTREIMDKEIDEVLTKQGISRRDFMKVAGAGATVAIAKLLGIGDDLATVTKVAEKAVPKGPIVPPYFFTLVDKIKRLGTDESKRFATMDREVVYVYKNYELYEDLTTGNIRINKKSGDPDFGYTEEEMVYTKGIGDESTQGTPPDEYDEFTVRPDEDGKMKDVDSGLDDIEELIDEVGVENISIKDLEAMGYEIDRLPVSVQRKLGIQKPISPIDRALKNSDDDLPDLPF